jgi:CRP/FNR family transcriptional regulator, cyclic AMP receptor protein
VSAPGPHEAPRSRAGPASAPSVRVLECDPELGLRVPADRITGAREGLVAPLHTLGRGVWKAPDEYAPGDLGFLVLEGLLGRDVVLAGTTSTELLGPGDVLHPFAAVQDDTLLRYHVLWHVLEPVRVAVLDETFARRLTAWPQVLRTLLERALRRSLRVSLHAGVLQLSPVETRLVMMFWLLAERWGRVTPAGVVVTLRLSHQLLGQLVGCRRASVTTALHRVEASGLVTRRADRTWLLHGSPPDELAQLHWAQRGERSAGRYDLATFGR